MAKDAPGPGPVHIDERFLMEWVEEGLLRFVALLAVHADFDAWCVDHERSLDG